VSFKIIQDKQHGTVRGAVSVLYQVIKELRPGVFIHPSRSGGGTFGSWCSYHEAVLKLNSGEDKQSETLSHFTPQHLSHFPPPPPF
jgi:hypothetical protein